MRPLQTLQQISEMWCGGYGQVVCSAPSATVLGPQVWALFPGWALPGPTAYGLCPETHDKWKICQGWLPPMRLHLMHDPFTRSRGPGLTRAPLLLKNHVSPSSTSPPRALVTPV